MTTGKLHLEGGKVVGTIEGLHYDKSIWMAMTKEQRDKAVALHQAKSFQRAAKVATTLGLTVPISKVLDKIDKLAHAVKSLDTKSAEHSQPKVHPSVLSKVMNAPSLGVQFSCMALISLERTATTINIDGLGTWDQGLTALEGCNPGGLVLWEMLVS